MTAALAWLWQTSLQLTVLIVLAWMLAALLRSFFDTRLAYAAWMLPLAAFAPAGLAPVSMVDLSVFSVASSMADHATPAVAGSFDWITLLALVWLTVATVVLITVAWRQRRFVRWLVAGRIDFPVDRPTGLPRWVPVHHSTTCPGPMLVGLLPPRLFLPAVDQSVHPWVIEHERAHLRHGDPFWNVLILWLQAVFWFHPLVHLAAIRARRDQELAADHAVTARISSSQRGDYARLLLSANAVSMPPGALPWKSNHPVKERIMHCMHSNATPLTRTLGISLLAIGVILAGLVIADTPSSSSEGASKQSGDSVASEGEQALQPLVRIAPRYPRSAYEAGITGAVTLKAEVENDGSLSNARVVAAEPAGVFDEVAIDAFSQWRFDPTVDGSHEIGSSLKADKLTIRTTIEFELGNG